LAVSVFSLDNQVFCQQFKYFLIMPQGGIKISVALSPITERGVTRAKKAISGG
jgi:hypothetical protein